MQAAALSYQSTLYLKSYCIIKTWLQNKEGWSTKWANSESVLNKSQDTRHSQDPAKADSAQVSFHPESVTGFGPQGQLC